MFFLSNNVLEFANNLLDPLDFVSSELSRHIIFNALHFGPMVRSCHLGWGVKELLGNCMLKLLQCSLNARTRMSS